MHILRTFRWSALAGGLAALALLAACGGSSSGSSAPPPAAGSGNLNLAVTDAPSDSWQQVTVVLKSASLVPHGSSTPVQVWAASSSNPGAGQINLVDLNSVATLLGTVSAAPGTYDALQLVINTDPSTMTLVDDSGATIPASSITVKGSGTLTVDLTPGFVVPQSGTATLQADFNLADPLSILETTQGAATQVVLDLQVRFKALPSRLAHLQFTRKLGQVSAPSATGFTLTDASGNAFNYLVDANTLYVDADAKAAGSNAGLTAGLYALVASNLNQDGTLYARRVWYAASAATLPTWTPEGLVRRVRPDQNRFTIFASSTNATATRCTWAGQQVLVDANTAWTFHDTVAMGTGTAFLQDIWRGCRVDVQFAADGVTATRVNVQSAYDEGFLGAVTSTGLTFGRGSMMPPPMAQGVSCGIDDLAGRTWNFYENTQDTSNNFTWWYFGLPSASSASAADLGTVVTAAQNAGLPATGRANLYWDTTSGTWQAYQLILEPEQLHTSVITTAYADGGSGSGTLGVTCLNPWTAWNASSPTPLTVTLDYAGDLQTLVTSTTYTQSSNLFTFVAPVPAAQWPTLLVPPAQGSLSMDRIWVRPVLNNAAVDWHAYTVNQYTLQ